VGQLRAGVRELYLIHSVQVDSGVHLASYLTGTGQFDVFLTVHHSIDFFKLPI